MSDLGALLKKAREQRNLSLDDIQDLTKIRKRYLEAIEEGNYSVLPGSFYVRAFVKNYAESVGLDAEEVLRLYNKEIPSGVPEQPVIEPVQRPRRAQTQTSDRVSRWGFRVLIWSFLLLIIVLVYVFAIKQPNDNQVDSADQGKMTDQTTPPATNPDKGTVKDGEGNTATDGENGTNGTNGNAGTNGTNGTDQTPQEPDAPVEPPPATTTLTLDKTVRTTDFYNVSPGGKHNLEIKSTGHAWVGIYQGTSTHGKMLLSQTMENGVTATVEAEGQVFISIGRADFVDVTVDGVLIDDGNKSGGSRKLQLNPVEGDAGTADQTTTDSGNAAGTQ
ncbi:helix-turn-helix domain-containing protein [Paenibacillus sacheonensis]|uniref:DUF4115 domain-containing protein n=1 Tax=Paenibacillus sacheonensis TaxID=742054 RepID=A0A7X4YMW3_9BACL|nr:helix-turn-helix domain-containing protein [Paenibacillus sacheonensis]MBM7564681.1 cytoskeletal protein RodZ [Paenibacillus sacheonensis]NBC69237.1 DUF4115 domain-containing protein [Paenibacillus sacheonensis]